jgi:hypothetical protein
MNRKLNFVWKNINEPFCSEFKENLDGFTSVSQAYTLATKINQTNNPDYNNKQSTSLGHNQRKKTSSAACTSSSASTSSSEETATVVSTTSTSSFEDDKKKLQDHLSRFKHEAQIEIIDKIDKLFTYCKSNKAALIKKIIDESGDESYEWAREILGNKSVASLQMDKLIAWNILALFHEIVDEIACDKINPTTPLSNSPSRSTSSSSKTSS